MTLARRAAAPPIALLLLAALACAGDPSTRDGGTAGLVTTFDSTRADSLVARTVGEVPAAAVRRVVEELRIAPTADDTTLFADAFEFAVGRDGRIFVYDVSARVIFLFDSAGGLLRRIGRRGAGPGEFNSNNGMVVRANGELAQWDASNARLNFFSVDGDFLRSWVLPSGFSTNNGLRTDASGDLLLYRPVTAPREGEILGRFGLVRLKEGGAFGDSLIPPDLPVQLVTYTAQQKGGTSSTTPLHAPRFLWAWHPEGYFVSVATSSYAIEASKPGRALRIVRDAPEIPVPEEERAWDQERITVNLRLTDPGWTWRGPAIPATKPPVAGLSVARDGRIWVRVAAASEPIPEAERDPVRPGRAPPAPYRQATVYEVFAPDGRFLGRAVLPTGANWMEAEGSRVWYLVRDADGLPAVVRARVEPALR